MQPAGRCTAIQCMAVQRKAAWPTVAVLLEHC